MARLLFEIDGFVSRSKDLGWGVSTVGRSEDNDVVITHPSVSSHHCEVELTPETLTVRDLHSTNGTFVNDRSVTVAVLDPGQTLRLGQVVVMVERELDRVSVPELTVPSEPHSERMADGAWSCEWHATIRAAWQCPKCEARFCSGCIREMRLLRGRSHKFCPKCSAPVEEIILDDDDARQTVWSRVKGFLRGS